MKKFLKIIAVASVVCTGIQDIESAAPSERQSLALQQATIIIKMLEEELEIMHAEAANVPTILPVIPSPLPRAQVPTPTYRVLCQSEKSAFHNLIEDPFANLTSDNKHNKHVKVRSKKRAQRSSVSPYPKSGRLVTLQSGQIATLRHGGKQVRTFVYKK